MLGQLVILVYVFVVGRFQTRFFAVYAVATVALMVGMVQVFKPAGLFFVRQDMPFMVGTALVLFLLLAYQQERQARSGFLAGYLLERERARAEALLLNILPAPVAARLQTEPGIIADDIEQAGVLFADIVDFTPLAATLPANEVVRLLNDVFTTFDELAERFGLEKIKTIGDAYMAAAGLPEPQDGHAARLAEMALAMQEASAQFQRGDGTALRLRVGINVGPVVAGVIGRRKFIYDLWGDTVNVAARMESQGKPGDIQCTEAAYQLLRDCYLFDGPVDVAVKGRGTLPVYLLQGRRPQ
jgi:class 3 adenylate cyclase